jgi:hypothetical protein
LGIEEGIVADEDTNATMRVLIGILSAFGRERSVKKRTHELMRVGSGLRFSLIGAVGVP